MCALVDVVEVACALVVDVTDSKLESVLESNIAFTGVSHLVVHFNLAQFDLGVWVLCTGGCA